MAVIISFCILIAINLVYGYFKNVDFGALINISKNKESCFNDAESSSNEEFSEISQAVDENWNITISKIGLKASIAEGVSIDVLSKSIGHYENSGTVNSNICLKAYSSGNDVNYFENIKNLRAGDEIIYKKDDFERTYIVEFSGVINSNDLSYLSQGDDNMITLITNIENEPGYLRCVQAVTYNS